MQDAKEISPVQQASAGLDASVSGIKQDFKAGRVATAIGHIVIGLAMLLATLGTISGLYVFFGENDKGDANRSTLSPVGAPAAAENTVTQSPGAIVTGPTGGNATVIAPAGGSTVKDSGNDNSVKIEGGVRGDVNIDSNNNNNNVTINGDVDATALKKLQQTVLRPKLTGQKFIDRYIDATVSPVADRPNVALHILELPGSESAAIQAAAGSALTNLGYHVLPLFREPFARDGLDKELLRGSGKLASELQLGRVCDSVLMGEVQIAPANRLQNFFISEATLYLHQISTSTGSIVKSHVVRAKGSGVNAEASAAKALRELEESLGQQLAEWTLT